MESRRLGKAGVIGTLLLFGVTAGAIAADPPADTPTPAVTDTSPVTPVDAPPAVPARPQTPEEKALQAHADALEAPLASAVSAGNAGDYATALDKIAAKNCRFFSVSGQSVTLPKFITGEQKVLATQGTGLTETAKTVTLTITGTEAIQTGILTDDQDVTDTAGSYGKKGKTHHWQRLTFFRAHWADAPTRRTSAKRASAFNPDAWKVQEMAFTDVQVFLDGSPYIPPSARKSNARRTTKPATKKRNTRPRKSTRRTPYVITGGQVTTF